MEVCDTIDSPQVSRCRENLLYPCIAKASVPCYLYGAGIAAMDAGPLRSPTPSGGQVRAGVSGRVDPQWHCHKSLPGQVPNPCMGLGGSPAEGHDPHDVRKTETGGNTVQDATFWFSPSREVDRPLWCDGMGLDILRYEPEVRLRNGS